MVPQPLDPADEVRGDALERGDVGRAVRVEVRPRGRGRVRAEDERRVLQPGGPGGLPVADQGLQRAAWRGGGGEVGEKNKKQFVTK